MGPKYCYPVMIATHAVAADVRKGALDGPDSHGACGVAALFRNAKQVASGQRRHPPALCCSSVGCAPAAGRDPP